MAKKETIIAAELTRWIEEMVNKHAILCFLLLWHSGFLTGCAGPLDQAARQALNATYRGNTYLAKAYLGSRCNLDYTNNSVAGRSPTGVFIARALIPWYETDASFFEAGSSGHEYTLEQLRAIDRDLDFDTFGQGILPGQVVAIKEITDKSDQLIFEVATVGRYQPNLKPRLSRIHCQLGKEGMTPLDQAGLQQMLAQLLTPVSAPVTEAQKHEFILAHYPAAPLADLVELTGFTKRDILTRAYLHLLSQSIWPKELQTKLAAVLAENQEAWEENRGLHVQNVHLAENAFELECAFQEIANAVMYHAPELRAAFLFFDKVSVLAQAFGQALAAMPAENSNSAWQKLIVQVSYLYFDEQGQRFDENLTAAIAVTDLRQFAAADITSQELADRAEIRLGAAPVKISRSALDAVQNIKQAASATWKVVRVEIGEWGYHEKKADDVVILEGTVKNTGTWIAENVEITAQGYDKYGFAVRAASTTLYGTLKPGETESFTIKMSTAGVKRYRLFPKWQEVK